MTVTEPSTESPVVEQPTSEEAASEQASTGRRGRGPAKPFPSTSFEKALVLAEGIVTHGIDGEMQRLTLLGRMKHSPTSSKTRNLITASTRYGLTTGSYNATILKVTEDGAFLFKPGSSPRRVMEKKLELAIEKFELFGSLYEKLKGNRLPDEDVIGDELVQAGAQADDRQRAAEIFVANLRHVGLVRNITGKDFVMSIDEVADSTPPASSAPEDSPIETTEAHPNVAVPPPTYPDGVANPSVHLDIQIHIDSTASAEQIEQIFSSMAKHLYGREA